MISFLPVSFIIDNKIIRDCFKKTVFFDFILFRINQNNISLPPLIKTGIKSYRTIYKQ